jgi:hypothetical protein
MHQDILLASAQAYISACNQAVYEMHPGMDQEEETATAREE